MWLYDKWNDYEIIDASWGEKLERWGKYILVRPDPQVIWKTDRTDPRWEKPNARYHRSKSGGGEWEFISLPETWEIVCPSPGLTFRLKPFSFKHTGLFPEQAVNWEWMYNIIKEASASSGSRPSVLNLFAYTGAATVAAAAAGAFVTHVDSSKGMVQWAKENARVSGIPEDRVRWITDDCSKFVAREIRRGHTYDAIIMDPPSYGRGPKGEIWKLEDNIYEFISLCGQLLSDSPLFVLVNSYTTGLQSSVLTYMLESAISSKHGGSTVSDEIGIPVTSSGLALPCGCSGRWTI
ncbi:MAG: class I SAM-dependent methyltransferase [Lachnospiraceae bacterium]|nr:class I SAM-dependent methyltransferase [Lachnospiraceae bacterium]